jgi:hypothetical protein
MAFRDRLRLSTRVNLCMCALLLVCGVEPVRAQAKSSQLSIPPGTILPIRLQTTISAKAKAGQIVRGAIAQDVPLAAGNEKIAKGAKVEGVIVGSVSATNGAPARVSVRFDKLYLRGETIPITTDLRALAGFMAVLEAAVPLQGTGESDVSNWLTTEQIGGDSVYGVGGKVEDAENHLVGKSLMGGGVLVTTQASGKCRGQLNGNDSPQALWVFSASACGIYGLPEVSISHAGRTDPIGTFTLEVESRKAKVASGAGLLLRVISEKALSSWQGTNS